MTHLVGCTLCGCYGDHPVERFLESIERAFNFADNQVLRLYGFSHRTRSSTKIRRFRSGSAFLFQVLAEEKARSCASSIGRSNKKGFNLTRLPGHLRLKRLFLIVFALIFKTITSTAKNPPKECIYGSHGSVLRQKYG